MGNVYGSIGTSGCTLWSTQVPCDGDLTACAVWEGVGDMQNVIRLAGSLKIFFVVIG